jgi:hypothetical protein
VREWWWLWDGFGFCGVVVKFAASGAIGARNMKIAGTLAMRILENQRLVW